MGAPGSNPAVRFRCPYTPAPVPVVGAAPTWVSELEALHLTPEGWPDGHLTPVLRADQLSVRRFRHP